jgi:CheY-like chemotaxis protein
MNILLIDDDEDDREIFLEAVRTINPSIRCNVASSASEAFNLLSNCPSLPRYIFLDMNMPVMDGRACLRKIKKDLRYKDINVVMYSTTRDKEEINVFRYLGAEYIHKPDSFDELLTSLSRFLT